MISSLLRFVALTLLVAPLEALVLAGGAPRVGLARASTVRMQDAPPPPTSGSRLGGTVDQDGKSNVWAVEPAMNVEKTDKGILAFAPIVGVAVLAAASIPLLPCAPPEHQIRRPLPLPGNLHSSV